MVKRMMMKKLFWTNLILIIVSFPQVGFSQLKGQSLNLEGVWKYEGGSGYEVWEKKNEYELVGAGYRLTKFGDTLKVEELRLAVVNGNLIYSLTTHQQTSGGVEVFKYSFISNKRKLQFLNIENTSPSSVTYKFGFFSKRKLKIIIGFDGKEVPSVLKLRKVDEL
jgi:hypothetical protein